MVPGEGPEVERGAPVRGEERCARRRRRRRPRLSPRPPQRIGGRVVGDRRVREDRYDKRKM